MQWVDCTGVVCHHREGKMKAYLMNRDVNPAYGVFEWWQTEDGKIFELDSSPRAAKGHDRRQGHA